MPDPQAQALIVVTNSHIPYNSPYTLEPGTYTDTLIEVLSDGILYGDKSSFTGIEDYHYGVINNAGTATITRFTFSGNIAGASGIGGAIYNNNGTASITGSTFSGNEAEWGGAIYNYGTASISDTTFSGNMTYNNGGAICNNKTISISGSTFSGNEAFSMGGAISNNGTVNFTGEVTLATSTDTIYNYNTGTLNWDLTGDITGKLNGYQWLENDGGPLSITVSASQAAGTYTLATGDFTTTTNKDTFTIKGVGDTTQTITIGGDSVVYNGLTYTLHTSGSNLLLDIAAPYQRFIVTTENSPYNLTAGTTYTNPSVYAGNGGAGEVQEGGILNANNVSISGNTVSGSGSMGGAISNVGTATITGGTFAGNTATFVVGAIFNTHNIAISGSTFNENTATTYGGAIGNTGIVFISGSTFSGNTAAYGGAIYNMGIVSFVGEVTLATSTDTIYNTSILNWNLTGDTTGKLNGYQWLTNNGSSAKLTITVNAELGDVAYSIATGNFTDVTGKNTFTLTGIDGQTDTSITIGGTASYGGKTYALNVIEGNLMLTNYNASNIYVNSTYSEEIGTQTPDGHIMGVNAFNNYTEAKAACVSGSTITQTGGSYCEFVDLEGIPLIVEAGAFTQAVSGSTSALTGGDYIVGTTQVWEYRNGDTSVAIEGGTFKIVCGADIVSEGSAERIGNVTLDISGGTFGNGAMGGMFFRHNDRTPVKYAKDTVWLTGDIDFRISGGTFGNNVYGGNGSVDINNQNYSKASSRTAVEGNITLTLDASSNNLVFDYTGSSATSKANIFAGSVGEGAVYGTTKVVVTGSHSISIEGTLSGGSGADYVATVNGTRTVSSNVSGSRTLEFAGFNNGSGEANTLGCKLFMFDTMIFKDDSIVELTYSSNFQDVENWTFEEGSSADIGNANNSFAGDTLNFTNLTSLEAGNEWKVLTAKESALDILNASAVKFDNVAAVKTESGWTLGDYTLSIVESAKAGMKDMAITRSLA